MQYFLETFAQDRGDRNESNAFEMRIGIRTTLLVFRFYRNVDDENTQANSCLMLVGPHRSLIY